MLFNISSILIPKIWVGKEFFYSKYEAKSFSDEFSVEGSLRRKKLAGNTPKILVKTLYKPL